ncbi:Aste57867_2754 [Aphanomyces stellatus]|uniref:Aste57867_2754 protein n=1 Tax=Aphanomyces stellatus TaxID=120398 RepID=A0A485KAR2_9STRA|nr:hypothetical protein As57867_002747 [Aphanomyces stellatus]VFT79946.1 Aste57867_2754 [Aphanomyces stellatus]
MQARLARLVSTLATPMAEQLKAQRRLGSFGLIADVQYANIDDGWNFRRTSQRYYRHGLQILRWATDAWLDEAKSEVDEKMMRFAVDLGDVIDGQNNLVPGASIAAIDATKVSFNSFQAHVGPVHHCVGNHELYNVTKAEYIAQLTRHTASPHAGPESLPPADTQVAYYTFTEPSMPSYEFVVLDPYGVSLIGSPEGSPEHAAAVEFLNTNNPNENKNSPLGMRDLPNHIVRATAFNGAMDEPQVEWLQGVLARAAAAAKDVVIFTHVPIHPQTCLPGGVLLWNYPQVKQLLETHASTVRAVFSGHLHSNGYACDHGIHYMVLHAALECPHSPPDATKDRAFATVDVYPTALHVRGVGQVPTRTLSW